MQRVLLGAVLALAMFIGVGAFAPKAQAEVINFKFMNCGQFLQNAASGSAEDLGIILVWLDGFLGGQANDPRFDTDWMEGFGNDLVDFCAKNQGMNILSAAKAVGLE